MFILENVSCGTITGIDSTLPYAISTVVSLIKVVIPVILVIYGMLDLGRAVASQKEEEIKKGQKTFFLRLIAAVIVFFVVAIVQLILGLVGGDEDHNSDWGCFNCFVNGKCNGVNVRAK